MLENRATGTRTQILRWSSHPSPMSPAQDPSFFLKHFKTRNLLASSNGSKFPELQTFHTMHTWHGNAPTLQKHR